MSSDAFFRMTVQDVFSIRGRGTVVTGQIEAGTLKIGDEVYITHPGYSKKVVVTGIEALRKLLEQAQAGDNVGVLLRDIVRTDVQKGDVLVGSDIDFS